jgi:hypothetical protein
MAIGDAAMPWADAARAIPGAADHQLYPAVVAWAAFSKAMHGEYQQAQDLAAIATEAQERLGTQHLRVHMASALVAMFTGDSDRAQEHAQEWVRGARAIGDPYELSSALLCFAAPLVGIDSEAALPPLEEAVQIARDSGLASPLAVELTILAALLGTKHPEEAMVILDEAHEMALLVGDRLALSEVPIQYSLFAIWRGDWDTALRAALDAAEQHLVLADHTSLPIAVSAASIALARLDALEASAVLFGAKDNWSANIGAEWRKELVPTEAILVATLGEDKVTALRARGAAMTAADVVEYLWAETQRVLG